MATWVDVGRIVEGLPETAQRSSHEWRVKDKLLVWERPLRAADYKVLGDDAPEGEIVGIRVANEGVKFELIADKPEVFFTTPHFHGYPAILAQLEKLDAAELEELVTDAWLVLAPKRVAKEFLSNRGL